MLYRQSRVAQAVALVNLLIAAAIFRHVVPARMLSIWVGASVLIYTGRILLQEGFRRRFKGSLAEFEPRYWENVHAITTGISGLCWGTAVFLLPSHAVAEQTFLGFMLAGTTAGAVVAYATSARVGLSFLLSAIIPFAFRMSLTSTTIQHAMAGLLCLYVLVVLTAIRALSRMIIDLLRLRHEQARTLSELKDAQGKLVHSAKMSALGEMAAGIAHEINNPLSIIHFYATQLKESDLPPASIEVADKIDKTSARIAKIVSGLRSFARGDALDKFQPTKLESVVNETLELCHVRQRKQRVLLLVDKVPPDVMINCRSTQIVQVLLNLLNNAFDAVEKKDEPWVGLEIRATDEQVTIAVADNGPGIPEEVRAKIMQPFFTTKETGKGTGLGLSIAHGIMTAHGGKLALDETSKQTRFVVTLPRIAATVRISA